MSLKFVDVMDPGTYYISNTYYIGKNSIKSKKREKSEATLNTLGKNETAMLETLRNRKREVNLFVSRNTILNFFKMRR